MSGKQELDELIPAFAIGATDTEESMQVQRYLAEDPSAAEELADFAQMADALLFAMPMVEAPATVETRLFAALNPQTVTDMPSYSPSAETKRQAQNGNGAKSEAAHWWQTLFGQLFSPQWAIAFAALALLLLVNGYWMAQMSKLRQNQLAVEQQLLQHQTTLSVIAMDERWRAVLHPLQADSEMDADLIWGEGFEVALLYVEEFPPLPAGQVYQLWLTADGKSTNGGFFTVNEHGTGTLVVPLPMLIDHYTSLEITAEPAGGSAQPTSAPLVQGSVEESILD